MRFRGFTLLELLLAVTLFAVVATTLSQFFFAGKKVYQRLHEADQTRLVQSNFFTIFERDLRQLISWKNTHMILAADRIYFHIAKEEGLGEITRVDYVRHKRYEGSGHVYDLERQLRPYPYDVDSLPKPESTTPVLLGYRHLEPEVLIKVHIPELAEDDYGEMILLESEDGQSDNFVLKWYALWDRAESPLGIRWNLEKDSGPLQWFNFLPQIRDRSITDAPFIELETDDDNSF